MKDLEFNYQVDLIKAEWETTIKLQQAALESLKESNTVSSRAKSIITKLTDDPELMREFNLQMRQMKLDKLKGNERK